RPPPSGCNVLSSTAALALPKLPSFPTRRSSDLIATVGLPARRTRYVSVRALAFPADRCHHAGGWPGHCDDDAAHHGGRGVALCLDRKSTRLNSSHVKISYAVFCLNKKSKVISST